MVSSRLVSHTVASSMTTPSAASPSSAISTPYPIQTGMASNCDKFYLVVTGDTCADIASTYDITLANFYAWNPAVGSTCANLWVDDYVCVEVGKSSSTSSTSAATSTSKTSTTTTPTTSDEISTPSPIQTGMTSTCDEFYLVVSGDTCAGIASTYDITLANFYAWNPAVGSSCGSLWVDDYVCVAVATS